MNIPSHIGKSGDEIVAIKYFDSAGYFFKSMAWLDHFDRSKNFSSLAYACADARHGIEYLLFEELVVSTGAALSEADYERCLKERKNFIKMIAELSPDYGLLQKFTRILISSEPASPKQIEWDHKALMKAWGILSNHLHWAGVRGRTTENPAWLKTSHEKIKKTVTPLWINITSGQSVMMHPKDMHPIVREIWVKYRAGDIDEAGVRFQLKYLKPAQL
jgi:hypothetical protein